MHALFTGTHTSNCIYQLGGAAVDIYYGHKGHSVARDLDTDNSILATDQRWWTCVGGDRSGCSHCQDTQ